MSSKKNAKRRLFAAPLLAATLLLTGCAGAELAHLAYATMDTTLSTKLYPASGRVKIPEELETATPMTYTREFWREDGSGKCVFAGVIVPWERTWVAEINHDGNTTVLPPEPGVRAGYVALVNEKRCGTAVPQKIFLVGEQFTGRAIFGMGFDGKPFVDKVHSVSSGDVLAMQAQNRPQWFAQSIERLTRLAPTHPAAKAFLAKSQDDLGKLLPAQYAGIQAAVR
jgi:hypothetical protein